jgi:hypothetical protein
MKTLLFFIVLLAANLVLADDKFYSQYLSFPDHINYTPTVYYAVFVDEDGTNRVIASNDPNLKFNILWLRSYSPEYKQVTGSGVFNELARRAFAKGYKAQVAANPVVFQSLPDETGKVKISNKAIYRIVANSDDIRISFSVKF